jgi:hypothetical protein
MPISGYWLFSRGFKIEFSFDPKTNKVTFFERSRFIDDEQISINKNI